MTATQSTIMSIMKVLFWIAFIGLCIQTGALLFTSILSITKPIVSKDLYMGLNLSELRDSDAGYYWLTISLLITLSALKAYIAFIVVKIFMVFDLSKPFSREIAKLFLQISELALTTGIITIISTSYFKWIAKKGISMPITDSGTEILFFAGIIYLLAVVFEKGSQLQTENDLTV